MLTKKIPFLAYFRATLPVGYRILPANKSTPPFSFAFISARRFSMIDDVKNEHY